MAMSFIIDPITLVKVTISMDETTFKMCLIIFPVAFISTSISPYLNTFSVTFTIKAPLTIIIGLIDHFNRAFSMKLRGAKFIVSKVVEAEWAKVALNLLYLIVHYNWHRLQ